jgi:proline utilization trans-activator
MPKSVNANVDVDNVEAYLEEESSSLTDETQPRYIGEAACTTFGSRLHQHLTADDSPPPPRRSHYYKNHKLHRLTSIEYQLPNRTYAQLLVRAVLRFMYELPNTVAAYNCILTSYQWT